MRPPDTLIFSPLLVADIFHRVNSVLTIYFLHNLVERYGRLYIHFSFVKKKNISRNIRKWRPTMFLFAKWKNRNWREGEEVEKGKAMFRNNRNIMVIADQSGGGDSRGIAK